MKFIGDVHGKYSPYKKLIRENRDTIQVGDLGIGFRRFPHGEFTTNPPYDEMVKANSRFIRGNHDNPGVCRNNTQWIKDGTVEGDVMFIGGAFSVDWKYRYSEFSWWDDEELSPHEMIVCTETFNKVLPRVMITHDCPASIVPYMPYAYKPQSRTSQFFDCLWQMHQPELWVYGHHHHSFDGMFNGTRFVCLAELEIREF